MASPFGDQETAKLYYSGASGTIPAFLYSRAIPRLDQLIGATSLQDMAFPVTNNLEAVPFHRDLWRITLWPINNRPAEWYIAFKFTDSRASEIRITRA